MKRQFKHIQSQDVVEQVIATTGWYQSIKVPMANPVPGKYIENTNDWIEIINKPEYTILSFKYKPNNNIWKLQENSRYNWNNSSHSCEKNFFTTSMYSIHSVRRESDNLVLTVDDKCSSSLETDKIESFELKDGNIFVHFPRTYDFLKNIKKVQPKEWEITAFRSVPKGTIWELNKNGYYQTSNSVQYDLDSMLTKGYTCVRTGNVEIYSVRRLSDNVEFKVGDNIQSALGNTKFPFKITNFILTDMIYAENNISKQAISILNIQKVERLFITEDKIDIFDENLEVYSVLTKSGWDERITTYEKYGKALNGTAFTSESPWKHFYNKSAREEYVILNKPCLSLNDISKEIGTRYLETLKELVKTKL